MGLLSEEQLRDQPHRHPARSADIRPDETPSQWIARLAKERNRNA